LRFRAIALTKDHASLRGNGQPTLTVETRLAGDLRPVPGDRIQLQQVLLNLVLNANEAMREPADGQRELLITSANDGPNGVLIMVRDTGKGFGPDDLAHVFNAFYTTKPESMGMGLTISRSIVQQHGGRLCAMQNEPRGAAFHCRYRWAFQRHRSTFKKHRIGGL